MQRKKRSVPKQPLISDRTVKMVLSAAKGASVVADCVIRKREKALRQAIIGVGGIDLSTLPKSVANLVRVARQYEFGEWAAEVAHPERVRRPENAVARKAMAAMDKFGRILAKAEAKGAKTK